MLELILAVGLPVLILAVLVIAMTREDRWLRRRARRYRQLELEGIEELRTKDPFPEQRAVPGAFLRDPDGRRLDADRVLHQELEQLREHTRAQAARRARRRSLRRGKGAECLV
ncbi:MAG: hypothetical protein ACRDL4_03370 [Thermoleophilaceae bacterium]